LIRKYLFLGLTLVLIVALVNLIIRGRRLEKEQAGKPVEVVKQSKPSPTRVLKPGDLEIVGSAMQRDPSGAALHSVEIRNSGNSAYGRIRLQFAYLDGGGKFLETKYYSISREIKPGANIKLDIKMEAAPESATNALVAITYADMESGP